MPLMRGTKRRAQAPSEEDEGADSHPPSSLEPATQRRRTSLSPSNDGATQPDSTHDQMVKKLVRLALASEYSRKALRRADISEQVLGGGGGGRHFKAVFAEAQLQLQAVWGMRLVPLPGRENVTLAQRRAAQKQSQPAKPPASWILASVLPAAMHDPAIVPPPRVPTAHEEATYTALYTLLIALIALSGGTLPDAKLERYLVRLAIQDRTPLPGYEKTEKLLKRAERDGYVVKVKEGGGGEESVEWIVGPRGRVEVGDEGVNGVVKAVYGELEDGEERELEGRIRRSLGVRPDVGGAA